MKRLTIVVGMLVLTGIVAFAAAQSEASSPGAAGIDERVTLDFYLVGGPLNHEEEVWANVEELSREAVNADLNVYRVAWGEFKQKILLLTSSGDDYDFHFDGNWFVYPDLLKNDAILDIDQMMSEYAPNLKQYLQDEGYLAWAYDDGRLMGVPWGVVYNTRASATVNMGLYEQYGFTEPITTLEQLEEFIVTVREDQPELRGLTNIGGKPDPKGVLRATLVKHGMDADIVAPFFYFTYDINEYLETGEVRVIPLEETDAYREAAEIRRRWFDLGIIPRNSLNDDETGYKLRDGTAIAQIDNFSGAFNRPPGVSIGGWLMYPEQPAMQATSLQNMFVFNANAANPERGLMFLEWMNASQENYDSVVLGIEGVTYELAERDGIVVNAVPEGEEGTLWTSSVGLWPFWRSQWMRPGASGEVGGWAYEYMVEGEPQLTDPRYNHVSPLAGFNFNTDPVRTEIARRQAVWDDYGMRLAFGLEADPMGALETFIERLDDAGMDVVREELQRQIDEFMASK